MDFKKVFFRFGMILGIALLAGCATNETKPVNGKDGQVASASSSSGVATNDTSVTPVGTTSKSNSAMKSAALVANPTIISFEKMSIVLDDKGKSEVAQVVERAKSANKIVITGFCDGRQIGNSENSAIARSVIVRDELIAQGVAPGKIQVKFNTKAPKKHAAEIRFD